MDLSVVIIDDELKARLYLKRKLADCCPDVRIAGEAESVASGKKLLQEIRFDLLFLDVQLYDGTGFDLLDHFPDLKFNVIFTTAYNEFAIRAFRYNAIDYLLKPIDPEVLTIAVQKAREFTDQKNFQARMAQLLQAVADQELTRITLQTSQGFIFTSIRDITRIETYGNYSFVFLCDGERHLVSTNLKEFEEILPGSNFLRVHQSHIVNTAFLKKYLKKGYVIMFDGKEIPVSRRRKNDLLDGFQS